MNIIWCIKFGIVIALGLVGVEVMRPSRLLMLYLIIWLWLFWEIICQIP